MDIDSKDRADLTVTEQAPFSIDLVLTPLEPRKKMRPEEWALLRACMHEILGEIEVEEKRIIEEERAAALEIFAPQSAKEAQSCK